MKQPVMYYSTNRIAPVKGLPEALLQGQAPDRGLYMPDQLPVFGMSEIAAMKGRPYAEVAFEVLRRFAAGYLPDEDLLALCRDAYDYDVPLEHAGKRTFVMRLDRGPTASFKDFAARMMARLFSRFMEKEKGGLVILTATSGDTGSAIAHAFHGVERIRVFVLFPVAEVSARQRKQMTTLGGNVTTIGVDGKFDDCQAMVKQAFADPALSRIRLSSANSINIGRLLPQACYYFHAYAQLAQPGEPAVFSVPSGNFGDLMGGLLAKHMGLPVGKFVVATNANDEVPRFFETGRYEKIIPSRVCISNAMNVGHPSNFARVIDLYGGQMDETGKINAAPDLPSMRRDMFAKSIGDEETRGTIADAYGRDKLLLEPHGAVAWAGLKRYFSEEPSARDLLCVSVETAHPAKFPEEIRAILGVEPEVPPSLTGIERKPEKYETMEVNYDAFMRFLLAECDGRGGAER